MWSVSSTLPSGTHLEVEDAKMLLREAIRAHRRKRSARVCADAAADIAAHAEPLLAGVRCATAYYSRQFEPGTQPLLQSLHANQVRVLLPMLGAGLRRDWAQYNEGDELAVRAPGRPPEPEGPGLGEDAIAEADLVLVPALSVDGDGMRLGQGGGWYDRVLQHANDRARIIAVLYDDEVSPEPLPRAEHDRPVHGVVTPSGVRVLP